MAVTDRQAQPNATAQAATDSTQITCKFTTQLSKRFRVPEGPVTVPSSTTRGGLSQIVNHLLDLDKPQPFDFIVHEELVRGPLENILLAHEISTETVLEVKYILAAVPPQQAAELPHDDWVSAVDGSREGIVMSGSCDGRLHCWNGQGEAVGATHVHAGGITSVVVLPPVCGSLLLSAGKDHVARLSQLPALNASENDGASIGKATLVGVYRGHTDSVECIAASPSATECCSGSWDASIGVWQTGRSVLEASQEAAQLGARKRIRRGSKDDMSAGQATGGIDQEMKLQLSGHTQCVSGVAWPVESHILSCSWDHSARSWDIETGTNLNTFNTGHALYCLAASEQQPHTAAVAGAGKAVRLWDTRQPGGVQAEGMAFRSHTEWVTAVAWHPTSYHCLLSASHDNTLKQWDVRASVPLWTLQGHTERVLSAAWRAGGGLASGGADSTLRLWQESG